MLSNGNKYQAYTSFKEVPQFPYKIIEVFLTSNEEMVEKFWKLLKYVDVDALEKPNLTYEEKKEIIYNSKIYEEIKEYLTNNIYYFVGYSDSKYTITNDKKEKLKHLLINDIEEKTYGYMVCISQDLLSEQDSEQGSL